MDTSKEFILMCEKAVEIQEGWIPSYHDVIFNGTVGHYKMSRKSLSVFLPRQDQLQEMWLECVAEKSKLLNHILLDLFELWRCDENGSLRDYPSRFVSMEQLWLAFVMEKLYSKRWSGTDWIKV